MSPNRPPGTLSYGRISGLLLCKCGEAICFNLSRYSCAAVGSHNLCLSTLSFIGGCRSPCSSLGPSHRFPRVARPLRIALGCRRLPKTDDDQLRSQCHPETRDVLLTICVSSSALPRNFSILYSSQSPCTRSLVHFSQAGCLIPPNCLIALVH